MNMQLPSNTLKKKHNSVDYHIAIEAFAADFSVAINIDRTKNPSNILNKPDNTSEFCKHTGPIIFEKKFKNDKCYPQGELQN